MTHKTHISPQTQTALQNLLQTGAVRVLLAGVYFVLGVQCERLAQHWRVPPCKDREQARRDAVLESWAGIPSLPARKRQLRRIWLSSFAINNSPDPNIRMTGHDAWATGRAYPRVPGICVANIRDLPETPRQGAGGSRGAARRLNAGNTQSAELICDSRPVLAPP